MSIHPLRSSPGCMADRSKFQLLIYGENHQSGVILKLRGTKIRDLREQLLVQLSSGTGRVRLAE